MNGRGNPNQPSQDTQEDIRYQEDCQFCGGTGEYPAQSGPDDFEMVECDCGVEPGASKEFVGGF